MYKIDLNNFNNVALVCDRSLQIIDANDSALMTFGYSFDKLTQMYFWELLKSKNEFLVREFFSDKEYGTGYEEEFLSSDGRTFVGAVTIHKIIDENNKGEFLVFIREVTDGCEQLKRFEEVNYLLRSILSINQAIIKKFELGKIFEIACFSFVNISGLKFAVFLRIDCESMTSSFVAGYGEYQLCCKFEKEESFDELCCLLPKFSEAVSLNQISVENNLSRIGNSNEFVRELVQNDVKSIAYLPVFVDEKIFGVLILGSDRVDYFDYEVILIIEEACNNLSYAVKDYLLDVKLVESEIKRKIFFERSPAGFAILDENGKVLDINNKFLELMDLDKDNVIDRQLQSILPKNIGVDFDEIIQSLPEKGFEKFEISLERNGKKVWIYGYLEFIEGFNYCLVVIFDQTEQKELQIALEIERRKSAEADKVKTYILQNISHEFRTPLSSILGFSNIIKSISDEPEIVENSQLIYDSGKRLYRTLESLVYTSQLVSGFVTVQPNFVDLNMLVEDFNNEFAPVAEEKKLDYGVEINLSNSYFCTDLQLLRHILFVLLDNALKFTSEGKIKLEVTEKQRDGHRFCEFKVIDTGIGLTSEAKEKIFEMFRQGSEGVARHYEGLGLGLFNAKLMVQLLGGEIEIESEEGEGTTVTVLLPELNCESI
jgi:PAS domain S-box-containing protein